MLQIRRIGSKDYAKALSRCFAGILLAVLFSPALAMPLINGDNASDAIAAPGEQDTFTFSAAVGDHVVLRIADTSSSGFVKWLH